MNETRPDLDALLARLHAQIDYGLEFGSATDLMKDAAVALAAERERADALALVIEQAKEWRENEYHEMHASGVGEFCDGCDQAGKLEDILSTAPSAALVAAHDAEVKAQALDEAVADLLEQFPAYGTNGTTAGWLIARAAEIRGASA